MKTVEIFKKWLKFVDLLLSLSLLAIFIICIGYLIANTNELIENLLTIISLIGLWCFKVILVGMANVSIIIAQDISVIARGYKINNIKSENTENGTNK